MTYAPHLLALVDRQTEATAYGEAEWQRVHGEYRASFPVYAEQFDEGDLLLQMVVRTGFQRDKPTVLLMHEGATVRRVDVNGIHAEKGCKPREETHVQGAPPPEYLEWLGDVPSFDIIKPGDAPSPDDYEKVFAAATSLIGIDIAGVTWIDPPEGGEPHGAFTL